MFEQFRVLYFYSQVYLRFFHAFLHLVPNMSLGVWVFGLGVRVLALGTKEIDLGIIALRAAMLLVIALQVLLSYCFVYCYLIEPLCLVVYFFR